MRWLGFAQAVREGDAGVAGEDEDDEEDEDFVFELDWNDLVGPSAEPPPAPPRTRAQRKQRGYKCGLPELLVLVLALPLAWAARALAK